jgi:hypothetical protein
LTRDPPEDLTLKKRVEREISYPPDAKEYRRTVFTGANVKGSEDFYRTSDHRIINAITLLVEKEGPIHKNVVKRRLANVFKVRLGRQIDSRLGILILRASGSGYVKMIGDFLWPPKKQYIEIRIQKGSNKRSIVEIPPQEIDLALIKTVRNSISVSEEDLIKEVARIFGFRATKNVQYTISLRIKSLLNKEKLSRVRGKIEGNK